MSAVIRVSPATFHIPVLDIEVVEVLQAFQDACENVYHIGGHDICPGVWINILMDSREVHDRACFQDGAQVIWKEWKPEIINTLQTYERSILEHPGLRLLSLQLLICNNQRGINFVVHIRNCIFNILVILGMSWKHLLYSSLNNTALRRTIFGWLNLDHRLSSDGR